jgi:hypothetical protein
VAGLSRFGQNAQPFSQEQSFAAALLLVTQPARLLDERVGKGGDLARH